MKILILKNIKTNKCRKVGIEEVWRSSVKPIIGDYVNKEELIVKIIEKERKMKYFETKVVKVKKEGYQHEAKVLHFYCKKCGEEHRHEYTISQQKQRKGNWVNGVNLDKIKFPCFCSYKPAENAKSYGQLNKGFFRGDYYYLITDESRQYDDANCEQFYHSSNLERLFMDYDIHILKGKIIIYDDDMEDKYSDE